MTIVILTFSARWNDSTVMEFEMWNRIGFPEMAAFGVAIVCVILVVGACNISDDTLGANDPDSERDADLDVDHDSLDDQDRDIIGDEDTGSSEFDTGDGLDADVNGDEDTGGDADTDGDVDADLPSSCDDGIQNGQETDVDCGGPDCEPCEIDDSCVDNSDCTTQVCYQETCVECVEDDQCAVEQVCSDDNQCVQCDADSHCDDGNPCTANTCQGGSCVDLELSDGTNCGGCHECQSGVCGFWEDDSCCIDGVEYDAGQENPFAPCQLCDPSRSTTSWSDRSAGPWVNCDDGNPCTNNYCGGGTCHSDDRMCGTECSNGICDGSGSCVSGDCCIDGEIYDDLDPNPEEEVCAYCDPWESRTSWSFTMSEGQYCPHDTGTTGICRSGVCLCDCSEGPPCYGESCDGDGADCECNTSNQCVCL